MLYDRFLFSFIIFFLCPPFLFAQSNSSLIKSIHAKYQSISNNLKTYDTIIKNESEGSNEGVQTIGYYEGKNLKLIKRLYFGETGKTEIELYFDKGLLFFVFDKQYIYNRPIYWDKKHMEENNDTTIYDPAKTVMKADRYYFRKEKLVYWLDSGNKEVDLSLGTNTIVGRSLIGYANELQEKLKE